MGNYHNPIKTKRCGTGGKVVAQEGKKLCYCGSPAANTKIGQKEVRINRNVRGSGKKIILKTTQFINVRGKDGKIQKAKMRTVIETPANRHNARQNIVSLGAIVDTELGKAKVTNRVGQDGVVNGILV
jgi:small subunit ribosomal protein S8e